MLVVRDVEASAVIEPVGSPAVAVNSDAVEPDLEISGTVARYVCLPSCSGSKTIR